MKLARPYLGVLALAAAYVLLAGFEILHSNGYVGATKKTGGLGCVCHGIHQPTDTVLVWIAGPDSVRLGQSASYTLFMKGGPAAAGGFDLAVAHGSLVEADTATQLVSSELTHLFPKNFQNDTVRWEFQYHAPLSGSYDTIFSVGNSVDLSGTPLGDQYNFGTDFVVHLLDSTLDVREPFVPGSFYLAQNYPNPFNPGTHFRFRIANFGLVTVKIFDLLGREVATVMNERKAPGEYDLSWNAEGLPSGVYLYRIDAGELHESRKMVLLR